MKLIGNLFLKYLTVFSTVIFTMCGGGNASSKNRNTQSQKISLIENDTKLGYQVSGKHNYYANQKEIINKKLDQAISNFGINKLKIAVLSPGLANLSDDLGIKIDALPSSWQYSESLTNSLEPFEKDFYCNSKEKIFYYSQAKITNLYKIFKKEVPSEAKDGCYAVDSINQVITKSTMQPIKLQNKFKKVELNKIFNLGHFGEVDVDALKFSQVNLILVEKNYLDVKSLEKEVSKIKLAGGTPPVIIPISATKIIDLIVITTTLGARLGNIDKAKDTLYNLSNVFAKIKQKQDKLNKIAANNILFLYVEGDKSYQISYDTLIASMVDQILEPKIAGAIFKDKFIEYDINSVDKQQPKIVFNLHSRYTKNLVSEQKWAKIANKGDIIVRYWKQNNIVSLESYEFFDNLVDEFIAIVEAKNV